MELPPIGSNRIRIAAVNSNSIVENRHREATLVVAAVTVSAVEEAAAAAAASIPPIMSPIAAERWNVQKKRLEFESEIDALYRVEIQRCMGIDKASNERTTKLYNEVFYKAKWSNPPLPVVQQKLVSILSSAAAATVSCHSSSCIARSIYPISFIIRASILCIIQRHHRP